MQTREKALAAVLGLVLTLWLIVPAVVQTATEPIESREATLRSLRRQSEKLEDEELATIRAAGALDKFARVSLGPDPRIAQRTLQSWLTDLADRCGWSGVTVTPLRTTSIAETASTVEVRVEGNATAAQTSRMLQLLTRSGVAHSVAQWSVRSETTDPSGPLTVTLRVEGLSMPGGGQWPMPYAVYEVQSVAAESFTVEPDGARFDGSFAVLTDDGGRHTIKDVIKSGGWASDFVPAVGDRLRVASYVNDPTDPAWQSLAEYGPFAIAVEIPPVQPRVVIPERIDVVRGDWFDVPFSVVGLADDPVIAFSGDVPDDLTLDADGRRLTWRTTDDTPLGETTVRLTATAGDVEALGETIIRVRRRNSPPSIEFGELAAAIPGRPWRRKLVAIDPDEDETVVSLADGPESAAFEDNAVVWTPPEEAAGTEVVITVEARDDAEDALTTTESFTVRVDFDDEADTELVGSVTIDGQPAALLINRRTGDRLVARRGQEIEIGVLKGTVEEVRPKSLIVRTTSGRFAVPLGRTVADRTPASD